MNKSIKDLSNIRFERLLVIKMADFRDRFGKVQWICKCDCGKTTIVSGDHLKSTHTRSCGCYQRDRAAIAHTIHNKKGSPEHSVWQAMKERCNNPKNTAYHNYGGRGIKVCKRWKNSFINFLNDMGERPSSRHTLERVKNNKGYSPKNCKWELRKIQSRNTRRNNWIEAEGKRMVITDWAKYLGLRTGSDINKHLRKKTMEELIELRRKKGCINYGFVPPSSE